MLANSSTGREVLLRIYRVFRGGVPPEMRAFLILRLLHTIVPYYASAYFVHIYTEVYLFQEP